MLENDSQVIGEWLTTLREDDRQLYRKMTECAGRCQPTILEDDSTISNDDIQLYLKSTDGDIGG
jgi:hypothetical protein